MPGPARKPKPMPKPKGGIGTAVVSKPGGPMRVVGGTKRRPSSKYR